MTNYHVIEDDAYTLVKFPENDRVYEAQLAGSDPGLDIAVLKGISGVKSCHSLKSNERSGRGGRGITST